MLIAVSSIQAQDNSVKCESNDGGRKYCGTYSYNQVQLDRQISGSACIQNQTWGVDSRGLWVDRGCRAYFRINEYRRGGGYRPVSQFTRDLVYVRPGTFVLFDRTTVAQASADQWLSFHTPVALSAQTTSDATQRRFDVGAGSTSVGSIRALLPRNVSTSTTNLQGGATRLEVHAPVRAAVQQWLSVVTTGAATGEQVRLSSADGNVASGNVVGVELAAPQGQVVLFAADQGLASVTSADYTVTQAAANHVLIDVEPSSAGYSVTAMSSGGKLRIRVSPGGSYRASPNKTLSFAVDATGSVSPGASAPPPTTP